MTDFYPNDIYHGPFYGTEGLPGSDGSNPLLTMGLSMAMNAVAGSVGMTPMGISNSNLYDRQQQLEMSRMHQGLINRMAQHDQQSFEEGILGLYSLAGIPIGADQRRSAQTMAGWGVAAAPMLSQIAPQFLEQITGYRGSATNMATGLTHGSRFRIDPVTGRAGMSEASLSAMGDDLWSSMYSNDRYRETSGLTAGDMGAAFSALQRQGFIGASNPEEAISAMEGASPDKLRSAMLNILQSRLEANPQQADLQRYLAGPARNAGEVRLRNDLSTGDLREAFKNPEMADLLKSSPDVSADIRRFDSEKIVSSLKDYQGAVKAMREIFGDAGNPNAPIPELINGLQQLTGGAMTKLGGAATETMVRDMANLAQQAGVGLPQLGMLMAQGQTEAVRMGLDPVFGARAVHGQMAGMQAYAQLGIGADPAWGRADQARMGQIERGLNLSAANSQLANQMAVASRLEGTSGGFTEGSAAAAYVAAIREGRTTFGPDNQSVIMNEAQFTRMLTEGSGGTLSQGAIVSALRQTQTNQEYIIRDNLDRTARSAQSDDIRRRVGVAMANPIYNAIHNVAGVGGQASALSRELAAVEAATLSDMSPQELANAESRNREVREAQQRRLQELRAAGGATGAAAGALLGSANLDAMLTTSAELGWGQADRMAATTSYGSAQNMFVMQSPEYRRQQDQARLEAAAATRMEQVMAPMGQGSLLQRAAQAIMDVKPEDASDPQALRKAFVGALGGVENRDDIAVSSTAQIKEFQAAGAAYRTLEQQYQAASPEERARLQPQLKAAHERFKVAGQSLQNSAERGGLYAAGAVSKREVEQLVKQQRWAEDTARAGQLNDPKNRGAADRVLSGTRSTTTELMNDERTMLRLGDEGRQKVEAVIAAQNRIEEAGSSATAADYQKLREATTALSTSLESGKDYGWLGDKKEQTAALADKLGMSTGQMLERLNDKSVERWIKSKNLSAEDQAALRQTLVLKKAEDAKIAEMRKKQDGENRKILTAFGMSQGMTLKEAEEFATTNRQAIADLSAPGEVGQRLRQEYRATTAALNAERAGGTLSKNDQARVDEAHKYMGTGRGTGSERPGEGGMDAYHRAAKEKAGEAAAGVTKFHIAELRIHSDGQADLTGRPVGQAGEVA